MTVSSTFFKILKKYKGLIILYSVILVGFGGINVTTNENNVLYEAEKPKIAIINKDEKSIVTDNFIQYLSSRCEIKEYDAYDIDDALFYRQVSYVLYIDEGFNKNDKDKLSIKTTGDYDSTLAQMYVDRYLKTQDIYLSMFESETEAIENLNTALNVDVKIDLTSKKNTVASSKINTYFNFASYSLLAGLIIVLGTILAIFNERKIKMRSIISSTSYKIRNRSIILSSMVYAVSLWTFYMIIGLILFKSELLNYYGLIYALNSLIFTFAALALGILLSNLINNKNALGGVVNVIAVGTSFLSGVFVPLEYLPNSVINIAHIFPTYWYVCANNIVSNLTNLSLDSIKPILINDLIILGFIVLFIILNSIVVFKKQKIA